MESEPGPPQGEDRWENLEECFFEVRNVADGGEHDGARTPPSEPPGWDDFEPAFKIQSHRARARAQFTLILVIAALLVVVVLGVGALLALEDLTPRESKDILALLSAPLFTLLGTVAAFYFKD